MPRKPSPKDERYTPRRIFEPLHALNKYTIDVAADPRAPSAQIIGRWYTKEDDGLSKSWAGERVFCNPPWSDIYPWVEKAHFAEGVPLISMLLPANKTEQPWFQEFVEPFRDGRGSRLTTQFLAKRVNDFGTPEVPEGKDWKSSLFHGLVLLTWR